MPTILPLKDLQAIITEVRHDNVAAIWHDCNAFWEGQLSISTALGSSLLYELTTCGQDLQAVISHIGYHKIAGDIDSQSSGV